MSQLSDILTSEQIKAVRAPIKKARTLPKSAFTSDAFFDLESEKIFSDGWAAVCFAQQVEKVGDVLPLELCGIPLLAVRGEDKQIRIFHNIVPYDGCLAAIDPALGQSEIVAPYHGWRYDLQGQLKAIPAWDGTREGNLNSLNGHAANLSVVRSATWGPVVFVNISGNAGPFDRFIAPLARALKEWRIDDIDIARDAEGRPLMDPEDIMANWKTHYENWGINILHESFVHQIYDQSPEVPRLDDNDVRTCDDHIDEGFMALRFEAEKFQQTYTEVPAPHLGLSEDKKPSVGYFGSLFPNLHIGALGTLVHFIIGVPIGPGRTQTIRAQFYDRNFANAPDMVPVREELLMGLHQAGAEDSRICEAVQKARHSPAFESQYYSPFWDSMHHRFSQMILEALE